MINLGQGPRQIKHIGSSIYAGCERGKFQPMLTPSVILSPRKRPNCQSPTLNTKKGKFQVPRLPITFVVAHSVKYFG